MEMKLELIGVPVTDVDKSKEFYVKAGFNADQDHEINENLRFVQLTPPGSACSICIGKGLTSVKPGTLDLLQVVVEDIQVAHDELKKRGIDVSEIEEQNWGKFVYFSDPDGNKWSVQQLPPR